MENRVLILEASLEQSQLQVAELTYQLRTLQDENKDLKNDLRVLGEELKRLRIKCHELQN